jgi:hypothetical protein
MLSEWSRIRDHWEKARITDGQFISQSEVMSAHYGALAREIVRRDFRIGSAMPISTAIGMRSSMINGGQCSLSLNLPAVPWLALPYRGRSTVLYNLVRHRSL